ncbi:putative guanine deaminase [Aspergillus affinis]|uniref:putative guanine deaminase n=1 Tax=Aspergillus affinis TaxID=1070780 RepID=UPI0022FE9DCA|nr:guanine deaminase [Aspergillus affinis]KAI9039606.1 guanine deaminase [Aspergillus affinis]
MAHSIHGTLIHSLAPSTLQILPSTLLIISPSGSILSIHPSTPPSSIPFLLAPHNLTPETCPTLTLSPTQFLTPGFIDTHTHAPQHAQRGLGRGLPLLTWLDTLTFPNEAKCKDLVHASSLYTSCVRAGLKQGITTACYYASLHKDASVVLAETCLREGQRALIGKCNMDRHAPDWYTESSDVKESVRSTEEFLGEVLALDQGVGAGVGKGLVTPVITPRFAISCTDGLLSELGKLVKRYPTLPVQTHFNESPEEVEFTAKLFPAYNSETEMYESFGLLNERSILAHTIYLKNGEMDRLKELGCGVAHCPVSNTCMDRFMVAPVSEYLKRGVKVGLGTDCGGGFTNSMLEVMRQAYLVSVAGKTFLGGTGAAGDGERTALSTEEGFYMATLGGARVAGLDGKVGNFEAGKELDACLVDVSVDGVMADVDEGEDTRSVFEKFIMTGDDRNITGVWVKGRRVKG